MGRLGWALGLAFTLLAAHVALAQDSTNFGGGRPEDRYFSVDASVEPGRRGPTAAGYILNRYEYHATRVRVRLQAVDASGRPLGPVTTYLDEVPPHQRTFFRAALPTGATGVQGSVESFEWAPRGGG
ncbi:MAG TPA: hypothetical protein VHZ49_19070 [Methylomirabilota bacterium]|jgi:hypothetical protein|nr:hypothetical protein [Methylomirabilota bacterium]